MVGGTRASERKKPKKKDKPTVYIESSVISYFCSPEELGGTADDDE